MERKPKVFKFGGAALKDAAAVMNVRQILNKYKEEKLVIVVSAIGKTTDALEKVVAAHAGQDGTAVDLLNEIKMQHFGLIEELLSREHEVNALVNDLFVEVDWALEEPPHENYDYLYDQIVSVGELVSSRIVGAYLEETGLPAHWVDARDVVLTDDIYREGWVQWPETGERAGRVFRPLLENDGFVITQGFIGSTKDNQTTTLGRAGSDYSAAIFSYCLDATEMTIWKDVPGMLTADPRFFKDAVKLEELSYREAIEMTYYGATVIHLKTIKPLQRKGIPLFVKSFLDPEAPGTRISGDQVNRYPPMVAVERRQAYLEISARDYSFVAEQHLADLFKLIEALRLQVNLMQNSGISFKLCLNDTEDKVDQFIQRIQANYEVSFTRDLELITVRHDTPEVLDKIRKGKTVLFEKRIPETVQWVARGGVR
jgi:aspartate kinase